MKNPLVSVIIVSYNTRRETVRSIKSVLASKGLTKKELEIVVVDNNSTDDSVSYITKSFPQVKLIKNKRNRGFGGANNQGAKVAKGEYLLLLNSDAFLAKDSLSIMLRKMQDNEGLLSVGPQLRYDDNRLQLSAGYFPTPMRVTAWMLFLDKLPLLKSFFPHSYHVTSPAWHQYPQTPDWLMGACIIFLKSEFLSVGGFDEQIFMYLEEVDLYRRLQDSFPQKKSLFTPATQVTHLGSKSTQKAALSRLILELRGLEYYYHKHSPSFSWYIRLVVLLGVSLRVIIFSLVPSKRATVPEYLKYLKNK